MFLSKWACVYLKGVYIQLSEEFIWYDYDFFVKGILALSLALAPINELIRNGCPLWKIKYKHACTYYRDAVPQKYGKIKPFGGVKWFNFQMNFCTLQLQV